MLTEQQEFVYNWVNSVDNAEFLKFKEDYKLGVSLCPLDLNVLMHIDVGCCGVCCCDPYRAPACSNRCSTLPTNDNTIKDLSPAEWWAKIDEIAAQNAAKGTCACTL